MTLWKINPSPSLMQWQWEFSLVAEEFTQMWQFVNYISQSLLVIVIVIVTIHQRFFSKHTKHTNFYFFNKIWWKDHGKIKKIAELCDHISSRIQFCCTSYFPDFRHSRSWVLECYGVRTDLTAAAAQAQCRRRQRQAGSCFSPQEGDFEATHGFFLLPRPGRFHLGLILGRPILRLTEVKNSPPVRLRQRRILQFVKLQNPRTSLHCTILWTPELVTSRNQTVPDPDEPDTIPVTS